MVFPTGNEVASTFIKITVLVPSSLTNLADDWLTTTIVGVLTELGNPLSWDDTGYTITAVEAADIFTAILETITIEPFT